LWWGEGFGGDGAIYSSIDGSGDAYPIGECDNASRVIKYVMLLGYRYSHYNLVDMRIHDINVEADLNRHNPNAPSPDDPVESDGTAQGSVSEDAKRTAGGGFTEASNQLVIMFWTPGWPMLNFKVLDPHDTSFAVLHFAVDLLNAFVVHVNSIAEWIHNIIDFVGDKAGFVIAILAEIFETIFEYVVIHETMKFAMAAWVLVDTVKFMDLSTTVLVASIAVASLISLGFIGLMYIWTATAIELFGYDEAGVLWLIVLLESLRYLAFWVLGRLDPNGLAATVIRISAFTSSIFGPFPEVTLLLLWWDWASFVFILGMIALSVMNIAYYFWMY
jgi:hypothetical protein